MENKHTPGPWNIEQMTLASRGGRNLFFEIKPIGICLYDDWILSKAGITSEQIDANNRLIVAAPDLLKACKRAASYLNTNAMGSIQYEQDAPILEQLYDAIQKAEGTNENNSNK